MDESTISLIVTIWLSTVGTFGLIGWATALIIKGQLEKANRNIQDVTNCIYRYISDQRYDQRMVELASQTETRKTKLKGK